MWILRVNFSLEMLSVRNSQINITIAADNKLSLAATILFMNNHRMEARLALEISNILQVVVENFKQIF